MRGAQWLSRWNSRPCRQRRPCVTPVWAGVSAWQFGTILGPREGLPPAAHGEAPVHGAPTPVCLWEPLGFGVTLRTPSSRKGVLTAPGPAVATSREHSPPPPCGLCSPLGHSASGPSRCWQELGTRISGPRGVCLGGGAHAQQGAASGDGPGDPRALAPRQGDRKHVAEFALLPWGARLPGRLQLWLRRACAARSGSRCDG